MKVMPEKGPVRRLFSLLTSGRGFASFDLGVLKGGLMLAAVDGRVVEREIAIFKRIARKCPGWSAEATEEILEDGLHADAAACDDWLTELHLVDTVVYEHLHVSYVNNLIPKVRENRKCEITVSDCSTKLAFCLCTLCVNMNPLMVESSVSKEVNTLLSQFYMI